MDVHFNIDPSEFQERKRRRIAAMNTAPPPPKVAPTSAPGVHEIATFLPGRLEFEHEVDNEAEDLVKDLEFGICLEWGGDEIIEDENDFDVKARIKLSEDKKSGVLRAVSEVKGSPMPVSMPNGVVNGVKNGHSGKHGDSIKLEKEMKSEDVTMENGTGIDLPVASGPTSGTTSEPDPNADEITQPPPIESEDSLTFKLTLIEMYSQRIEKRREAKAVIFDRGLLEYKKVCDTAYLRVVISLVTYCRCKLQRRSDRRKRRILFIDYGPSQGSRLRRIMKCFQQTCCVCPTNDTSLVFWLTPSHIRRVHAEKENPRAPTLSPHGLDHSS
jgi:transcriptional adapter 2-alpha